MQSTNVFCKYTNFPSQFPGLPIIDIKEHFHLYTFPLHNVCTLKRTKQNNCYWSNVMMKNCEWKLSFYLHFLLLYFNIQYLDFLWNLIFWNLHPFNILMISLITQKKNTVFILPLNLVAPTTNKFKIYVIPFFFS